MARNPNEDVDALIARLGYTEMVNDAANQGFHIRTNLDAIKNNETIRNIILNGRSAATTATAEGEEAAAEVEVEEDE
jgi:hypothetical protein